MRNFRVKGGTYDVRGSGADPRVSNPTAPLASSPPPDEAAERSDIGHRLFVLAGQFARSCVIDHEDLLQTVLEHDLGLTDLPEQSRVVAARRVLINQYRAARREHDRMAYLADQSVDPVSPDRPDEALERAMLALQILDAVSGHVERDAGLAPAVDVVLYGERPRTVAANLQVPVADIYTASERLRARLRADRDLQRLWLDQAA